MGFGGSFGSEGIEFGLAVGGFFLQFPELLDFLLFFILESFLFDNDLGFLGGFLLEVGEYFFLLQPFVFLPLLNSKHHIAVGAQNLLVYFLLLLFFPL